MKEKTDITCPQLSMAELQNENVIFGSWQRAPYTQVTTINYSFNLKSLPALLTQEVQHNNPGIIISSLPRIERAKVRETLQQWKSACGDLIEFNYVQTLDQNQLGLTIVGCDNLNKADGLTHYNHAALEATGSLYQAIICLPSKIKTNYDSKVYAHEIGHGLGFGHIHEVDSIRQQLGSSDQGLGCSVMGYEHLLKTPQNRCRTTELCKNETYAVIPGPMDQQICQAAYKLPSFSFDKYKTAVSTGMWNGATEKAIDAYLSKLEFLNIGKETAANLATVFSTLLQLYLDNNEAKYAFYLASAEILCRTMNIDHQHSLKLFRNLLNTASIFFTLYQLYGSEEAMVRAVYLTAFLGGNFAGMVFGKAMGEEAANLTNTFVNNLGTLFNQGKVQIAEKLPGITHKINSVRHWFFGSGLKKEVTSCASEESLDSNKLNVIFQA